MCLTTGIVGAQTLSPNGYSGVGVTPSATSLISGGVNVGSDQTILGGLRTAGSNQQVGFGIYQDIELVGRLATNDLKCNMFQQGACPAGNIRDFSASMKWRLPLGVLKDYGVNVAVGVTDVGGAASYFKSYYAVAEKKFENLDVSVGQSKAVGDLAVLKGSFGAITWRPTSWANLGVQKVGANQWSTVQVTKDVPNTSASVWLSFNQRLSQNAVSEKNWVGWGVSVPLDVSNTQSKSTETVAKSNTLKGVVGAAVKRINHSDLRAELERKGFFNPRIGRRPSGAVVISAENTSYQWNSLDAAGVVLGVISGAYGLEPGPSNTQNFELILTTRGINQFLVTGEAKCVARWISGGDVCESLSISSLLHGQVARKFTTSDVSWESGAVWNFRPDVILSPSVTSAVGTEYGAFDMDLGLGVNTVLPLWAGATIETNSVRPLGIGTRGFEEGGVFYEARIKPATTRKMVHQLVSIPEINSQVRLSAGTAYTAWDGKQVETSTQSESGRHKLGFTAGAFTNESYQNNSKRDYRLVNYRFAHDDNMSTVSEITQGKYWAGDRGWSIAQKFWHGDTFLNVYLRRTRMTESTPLVSFAGVQIAIPFTPRENKSLSFAGIRGASQWSYALETRVFDKQNLLTGGFGEVPRIGENLVQTFNRDRNSTRYLEANMGRMRGAYLDLVEKNMGDD